MWGFCPISPERIKERNYVSALSACHPWLDAEIHGIPGLRRRFRTLRPRAWSLTDVGIGRDADTMHLCGTISFGENHWTAFLLPMGRTEEGWRVLGWDLDWRGGK